MKCLQDYRVLITTLSSRERTLIQDLAAKQGAVLLSTATPNDPPHVVITRRVGSPKYIMIMRRYPQTPVVTPQWLLDSIQAGRRLAFDEYAVKPFQGLTVCFSGLRIEMKRALAEQVVKHGGEHSASLDKECTHLVTISTDSDKYRWAILHNILCVTPQWLEDSIAQGWCQDDRQYAIDQEGVPAGLLPLTGTQQLDSNPATAAPTQQTSRGHHQQQLEQQQQLGNAGDNSLMRDGSIGARGSQGVSGASSGDTRRAGIAATENSLPPLPLVQHQLVVTGGPQPPQEAFVWNDLDWDDSIPPFLDACYMWSVGCTPSESFELIKCSRQGAAKRFLEPVCGLTHIVVGSDLSSLEADQLAKAIADNKSALVVRMEWLRRSAARREMLPADERFLLSSSDINDIVAKRGFNYGNNVNSNPEMVAVDGDGSQPYQATANTTTTTNVTVLPSAVLGGDGTLSRQISIAAAPTGCFSDCYFTLAALPNPAQKAKAEQLIRANGGKIFTAMLPPSVTTGRAKAIAICPPSLTPPQIASLRNSNPDFAAVEESAHFTVYWLECCIAAKELLSHQRISPCYKPLPYALPLPGMENISIAVSGYPPSVREAMQRTVEIVGGRVSMDCMSAKDTHLVIDAARGEKYKHAARFKVIPVTAHWLVDSILYGRLQPEQNYKPLPLPGQVQPNLSSLGPDSASGPSQIGATQLPTTNGTAGGLPAQFTSSMFDTDVAASLPKNGGAGNPPPAAGPTHVALERTKPTGPPPKFEGTSLRARIQRYTQGASAGNVTITNQVGNENVPSTTAAVKPPQIRTTGAEAKALLSAPAPPPAATAGPAAFSFETIFGGAIPPPPPPLPKGIRVVDTEAKLSVAAAPEPAPPPPTTGRGKRPTNSAKKNNGNNSGKRISPVKGPLALTRSAIKEQQKQQNLNAAGVINNVPTNAAVKATEDRAVEAVINEMDGLEAALDNVASLLDQGRSKNGINTVFGSQEILPLPMPTRKRSGQQQQSRAGLEASQASKRSKGANESGVGVNLSPLRNTRKSTRRGESSLPSSRSSEPQIEMSQQVGYDEAPVRSTRSTALGGGSANNNRSNSNGDVKQRLRQMARQKRSAGNTADI